MNWKLNEKQTKNRSAVQNNKHYGFEVETTAAAAAVATAPEVAKKERKKQKEKKETFSR